MSKEQKGAMSKEQLLQGFADAYEQLIETASLAAQRDVTNRGNTWGSHGSRAHSLHCNWGTSGL